ncbi:MAG TPA: acyl-CoA dehydrogenase family protein [Xanthobacteraceae bacterium]|nr:acyl-CoA dehydrogenase family protein [Xanthobacteraceae bacterium]
MVDFSLTPRQRELRQIARDFALDVVLPAAEKADRIPEPHKAFDWGIVREGSRRGLRTLTVPKQFGGEGADVLTCAIVGEQICYGDLGIGVAFDQTWKIMTTIAHLTNDDQRKRWLPRIVEDPEFLLGIAMTEPMHGSDNILPHEGSVDSRAEKRGDKWVLNGAKRYISNGGLAKLYYVIVRTADGPMAESLTGFLVPADAPGFRVTEVWDKLGQRAVQNGTLQFDNVEIPDADRVGEVGKALPTIAGFLLRFGSNVQAGASVLGVAQRAYDLAHQYAFERVQGGRPIIEHELQRLRLARMAMKIQAARAYLWFGGWDCGQPEFDRKHASLAKIFASEVAVDVCRDALELWGAAGYMRKNPIEKLMRDALSFLHSDGTNDVLGLKAGAFIAQEKPDPSARHYSRRSCEAAQGR